MKNYYESQLNKLDLTDLLTIKISGENGATNHLNLNAESVPILIKFLERLDLKPRYGDKRDYPKIDIYADGIYQCSTTWAKTCKEAITRYKSPTGGNVKITARRAKS